MNDTLIVIAARNEEAGLATCLPTIKDVAGSWADIIVVSDGSTDQTASVAACWVDMVVVKHTNQGKLASVIEGTQKGLEPHHKYIIVFDGDGQHDPGVLCDQHWRDDDLDVVFASRYREDCPPGSGTPPIDRQLLNQACRAMVEGITGWGLTDPLCGLRRFNRSLIDWLLEQTFVSSDGYGFELETLIRLWHLSKTRNIKRLEVPHPAIYNGSGKIGEIYDDAHLEERLRRIMMHQRHLVHVLRDLGVKSL